MIYKPKEKNIKKLKTFLKKAETNKEKHKDGKSNKY
tara:strand:- start:206 stop:313 length:108 start_codon:yes stop_codon:yes gene_type:complete